MSKSRLFSGKIKKLHGGQLSVERYNYLDSSQAEPDLGSPSLDGALLVGSTSSNVRTWSQILTVDTATFTILSTLSNRFSDQPQALDIKGGAIVRGNLHVSGTAYLNDAEILTTQSGLTSVLGNSIINQTLLVNTTTNATSTDTGALRVLGGVGIGLDLYVGGAGYINNAQIVTTATIDNFASKTTIVAGTDTAINTSTGIVTVWNTSTLQSVTDRGAVTTNAISITNTTLSTSSTTGALVVSGGVGVLQDVYIGQNLYVAGTAYLNDAEVLTTSSGLSSTLGQTEVSQNLFVNTTTNSTSTTTGAIVTPGGVGIGKNLYVGENLYVDGTAYLNNAEVLTTASRITSLEGLTQVTQDFLINTTTNTVSLETGALQVRGGAAFVKDVRIGQSLYVNGSVFLGDAQVLTTASGVSSTLGRTVISQELFVNTTTNSVSTETGAIVTPGGVGIGQDVFIGGKVALQSTLNSTSTLANNALYVAGGAAVGQSLIVDGPAYFRNTVVFAGTTTNIASSNTFYTDNLINIHVPQGSFTGTDHSWTLDDGKDQGFVFHYYKDQDRDAFLGFANDTGYLEWYDNGTEVGSIFTGTSYGTFKTGAIILASTTASGSTTTGALIVAGGVGIGGNLHVGQNLYVPGIEVEEGLTTITNATSATSTTSGALVVTGGVGIGKNIHVAGDINFSGGLYNNGVLFTGGSGGSGFTSSDVPPEDPVEGDRWYDTTLGLEFVWVLDDNSGQWVEISTAGNGEKGADGSQGYGSVNFYTRNYIGNSTTTNFVISANLTVDNVFVFENGVMQFPTTDYSVIGTTLSFVTPPATGVAVQIREINNAGSNIIPLTVQAQGTTTTSTVSVIDFVGNVVATNDGSVVTVTIEAGSPKMSSIIVTDSSYNNLDDTAVALEGGYIKIIGSGFASGCSVLIGNVPATSTTFISSTEVRAQVPATSAGTYIVYLVNTDGGTAIRVNGITFSSTPTWVTSSGLSGTSGTPVSFQLSATGATTFALQAGSTLPSGLTLTSGGLLSGTVTIESDTVYSVTILATDNELQDSPRTFSITITAGDLLFMYNSLLLAGNGTNNANNNTILDSSTNNFTVTRNGNTTQGTFTPYGSNWSAYIPSAGQTYLTAGSNTALALGSGDFTVECWLYLNSLAPSYTTIFDWRTNGSAGSGIPVITDVNNNGTLAFAVGNGSGFTSVVNSSSTMPINSWFHLAVVRSGSTVTMYFNGTSVGTGTSSANCGIETFNISNPQAANYTAPMYVSNVRLVKGTAVYTANFTPSTVPLTAVANTQLLTLQSPYLKDNSTNAFAVSKVSTISIQRFSPFNPVAAYSASTIGGSAYFDGNGDYLDVAGNAALGYGTGDFEISFWYYAISASGYLFDQRTTQPQVAITIYYDSGTIAIYVNGSIPITVTDTDKNAWHYLTLSRVSGTTRLFVDGTQRGSNYTDSNNYGTLPLRIGCRYATISDIPFNGYMSDLRIIKGSGVSSQTVPTSPLTAVANTSLLLNYTNAGIIDNSMMNNLETVGDAKISTVQSKFGGSSLYFDGTGDYLFLPTLNAINLSKFLTAKFTVECWAYLTNSSSDRTIISAINSWGAGANYNIEVRSGGLMHIQLGNGITMTNGSVSFPLNQWNHIALVRTGATSTVFYLNGVAVATDTNNWTADEDCPLTVGCFNINGGSLANYWSGYIDDLRITKGVARYTTNFTPSTYPVKLS